MRRSRAAYHYSCLHMVYVIGRIRPYNTYRNVGDVCDAMRYVALRCVALRGAANSFFFLTMPIIILVLYCTVLLLVLVRMIATIGDNCSSVHFSSATAGGRRRRRVVGSFVVRGPWSITVSPVIITILRFAMPSGTVHTGLDWTGLDRDRTRQDRTSRSRKDALSFPTIPDSSRLS